MDAELKETFEQVGQILTQLADRQDRFMQGFEEIRQTLAQTDRRQDRVMQGFEEIQQTLAQTVQRQEQIEQRQEQVEQGFEGIRKILAQTAAGQRDNSHLIGQLAQMQLSHEEILQRIERVTESNARAIQALSDRDR